MSDSFVKVLNIRYIVYNTLHADCERHRRISTSFLLSSYLSLVGNSKRDQFLVPSSHESLNLYVLSIFCRQMPYMTEEK